MTNPTGKLKFAYDTIRNLEAEIAALKQALAQPEQNLSCKSTQARLAASWGYVKAQPEQYSDIVSDGGLDPRNKPEQEPVAIYQFRAPHCSDWYDGIPDQRDGRGPYQKRTLYTSPPKRQPLTNEQIDEIVDAHTSDDGQGYDIWCDGRGVARAIEAAHDIGENA